MPERKSTGAGGGHFVRRTLLAIGAAVVAFVLAAIFLAVLDIYLVGHGHPSLMAQQFIAEGFVQLSAADAIALAFSACAGIWTFLRTRRK